MVFGYGVILMNFSPMVSMAAGTQLALTALYSSMSLGDTLLVRLLFVLTGTFVAVSVIFVLLRSRRSLTISNKMEEMSRVDERLLQQVRVDMEKGRAVNDRSLQLLYYLHMNAHMLNQLSSQVEEGTAQELERLIEANFRFAMDAAHAIIFLDSTVKHERYDHLDGTTRKLRMKIDDLPLEDVSLPEEDKIDHD